MLNEITIEDCQGKVIRKITLPDYADNFIITFEDDTFIAFRLRSDRYDDSPSIEVNKIKKNVLRYGFVEAGVLSQDEFETLRKEKNKRDEANAKAYQKKRDCEEYERLKKLFGDEPRGN